MSIRSLLKSYSSSSQKVIKPESLEVENRKKHNRVSFGGNTIKYYSSFQDRIDSEPTSFEIFNSELHAPNESPVRNIGSSDMDCSFPIASPSKPSYTRSTFRTGIQLLSEFEQLNHIPKLQTDESSDNPFCQYLLSPVIIQNNIPINDSQLESHETLANHTHRRYLSKETSPPNLYLTPVKEESESIHSSGDNKSLNYYSSCPIQPSRPLTNHISEITPSHNLCMPNTEKLSPSKLTLSFIEEYYNSYLQSCKQIDWGTKEKNVKPGICISSEINHDSVEEYEQILLAKRSEVRLTLEKQQELIDKKNEYDALRQTIQGIIIDLKKFTHVNCNPSINTEEFNRLYKEMLGESIESIPLSQRWEQTVQIRETEYELTAFRHVKFMHQSAMTSQLIIIFTNCKQGLHLEFKRLKEFGCKDLNKISDKFFNFLERALVGRNMQDILYNASNFWHSFLNFEKSFETMELAIGYTQIIAEDCQYQIRGKFADKEWEYFSTYASIETTWDILTDISNLISSL